MLNLVLPIVFGSFKPYCAVARVVLGGELELLGKPIRNVCAVFHCPGSM